MEEKNTQEQNNFHHRAEEKVRERAPSPLARSLREIELLIHRHEVREAELELRIEALRETEKRRRVLFESTPIGIACMDRDGRVIESNRALQEMLGYTDEELRRMVFTQFTYPEEVGPNWALFQELIQGKRDRYQTQARYYRKDGKVVWGDLVVSLVRDDNDHPQFAIGMVKDISDCKQAEEQIQGMNETLREANLRIEEVARARNRFFSYISHELKNPVNSIIGFAQMFGKGTYGPVNPEQSRILARIYSNAEELVQLINNILDLAAIESGKVTPQIRTTDLREILEKVAMTLEPLFQEKGLTFEKRVPLSFPGRLLTDPSKIRSILANLLSNAIKFTHQGEIRVDLKAIGERGGFQIRVSDTGIGIEPEYLKRIFEEFKRSGVAEEAPGKYTGGTGLGLAIVKKMVDSLGGRIEIESAPGQGTAFTIEIPEQAPTD